MDAKLEKAVHDISARMRRIRAMQEDASGDQRLPERDEMILSLLMDRGRMTVSQLSAADSAASDSTISTTITRLWRKKGLVSKSVNPEDQRETIIELTDKGRQVAMLLQTQRSERFKALFSAIRMTDDEKEIFLRVLERATAYLDRHYGPAANDGTARDTRTRQRAASDR